MARKHIIVCVCLIVVLVIAIVFILQGTGIQWNSESKYLPQDMGEALWKTEDGDSWFKVENGTHPTGEITLGGKTSKAYYVFAGKDNVSVVLYEDDILNSVEEYNGNCEFYKNKVSINLDIGEEKTVFMEFKKQQ